MNRRTFLIATVTTLFCNQSLANDIENEPFHWQLTLRNWLAVLMPADQSGSGGNSAVVWNSFTSLMQSPNFKQGLIRGLTQLEKIPLPKSETELATILNSQQPIANFLNALLDLAIEAYYGSDIGWGELNIDHTPQPLGFVIT